MYKVFIENRPIIFQIKAEDSTVLDHKKVWNSIHTFLASNEEELIISINEKDDFLALFKDYKYIEAAGGLVQRDNRFLFIYRNGCWDIPKGKVDPGETVEETAVRELEEECGLKTPILKELLTTTYHTYEMKGKHVLKKTYWYRLEEGKEKTELVPQLEEGITEVRFFEPANFDTVLNDTFLSIKEVIVALEKKLK